MADTTATTIDRGRRRPVRAAAGLASLGALVVLSCAGPSSESGTLEGSEEVFPGRVHECAGPWPVPEQFEVEETARGRDQAGEKTCVVTLRTDMSVPDATQTYAAALGEADWQAEVAQHDDDAGLVHLHGPLCGVVLILTQEGRTSAMASVLDCARARPFPDPR